MKKNILLLILLLSSTLLVAQRGGKGERMKELRKQYLEEQLNLDAGKAAAFWEVYGKYESERKVLRKEMRALETGFNAMTDTQLQAGLDKMFSLKAQELALDKKYFKELQKVISIRQIAVLYQAEHNFKKEVLRKFRERVGEGN